jgi:gamma-glutamylcyclotransferase (GGCT)/AIG2-like uncharacterized protein YtfP
MRCVGEARDVLVFSYGTLQDERVQLACFGRRLAGEADVLTGYTQSSIETHDPEVPDGSQMTSYPILDPSGNAADEVAGRVFRLSVSELASADEYEGREYRRIRVQLRSGNHAWVYARA